MSGELFKSLTHTNILHIPYKGSGQAMPDLISGRVSMMFENMPGAVSQIKAGKLRALAVTGLQHSSAMPELPTVAEAGVPGFESITWHGVVVPSATPAAIIERLNRDINAALRERDLRDRLQGLGVEVAGGSPQEFAAYIAREIPKWTKVVKDSGARVE